MQPDVTIAISTLAWRLPDLSRLPVCGNISWIVLVQGGSAPLLSRADLRVIELDTIGLSASRNAAMDQTGTRYLVFADDDHCLDLSGIRALADLLDQDPSLSFVAGIRSDRYARFAARGSHWLNRWTSGRLCAPEMVFRVSDLRKLGVRFDTAFGVGARWPMGEDYIFVCDLLGAGAQGCGFALPVGHHKGISSGDRWEDPALMAARSQVLFRVFGNLAYGLKPLYAMRHLKRFRSLRQFISFFLEPDHGRSFAI